jgi:hypothetical protein
MFIEANWLGGVTKLPVAVKTCANAEVASTPQHHNVHTRNKVVFLILAEAIDLEDRDKVCCPVKLPGTVCLLLDFIGYLSSLNPSEIVVPA